MNIDDLARSRLVLGDGAVGTMLQRRGLAMGDCPERFNLDAPEVVAAIHAAYAEAGSDFVETNTFGASRIRLARYGLESRLQEIIKRGVDAARKAVGTERLVAGSVGPTGALLEPYGDTAPEKVSDAYREAALIMEGEGVDFFLIETVTDLAEGLLALRAVRATSARPVVVTISFSKGLKGYRTMMGNPPMQSALAVVEGGAALVGTNCCNGVGEALGIVAEMSAGAPPVLASAPLVAQPNAGRPGMEGGEVIYPETPADMAAGVGPLLQAGVRVIGGCCGTTPDHIKHMAVALGKA